MTIPKESFSSLKMCEDPLQTGCVCGWRTFREGYNAPYVEAEKEFSLVTNPITWKTDSTYAPKKLNTGSVLFKFNKIYKRTTDAQIYEGTIWVRIKFPWSFFIPTKNYHVGDINLYYMNIRENVGQHNSYFHNQSSK
jgi:hypothetical protein